MFIRDRFTRGMLAGIVAGIITKVYDLLAFSFHFSTLRWFDFSGIMIYGKKPLNLWEQIFATLGVWFFHAILGVIFVLLIQRLVSSDNLFLKGWLYGVAWWFIIYAIAHLYKVPQLVLVPLKTSVSNFVGASIWGVTLAAVVRWLDTKAKL